MAEVFKRFIQTLQLRREAFVWMDFNDRATGDALILVALTALSVIVGVVVVLPQLISYQFGELAIDVILATLVQWLIYMGILWAIVRYGYKADAQIALYLRFTGFAFPTTLLTVAAAYILRRINVMAMFIGFLWFIVIVGRGIEYGSDVPREKALLAALGGLVGLVIVNRILKLFPLV